MQFFEELGRRVEQQWRDKNYDEAAFPGIAARALGESQAAASVSPWEITGCLHRGAGLPFQREDEFSDLPVNLYHGPRFAIDVYFWMDGTTSIHQHSFSGAFQVLMGSSLHSTYGFTTAREINAHFSAGSLQLKGVEVLQPGMVREILPGRPFIHSLFHLERPSATITIRTNQTPSALPQFNYLRPSLAFNPFFKEQLTVKRVQSVAMLLRVGRPEALGSIAEVISSSDLQTAFLTLTAVYDHLVNSQRRRAPGEDGGEDAEGWGLFYDLYKEALRRHGETVNLFPPVIGEMQRQKTLVGLRGQVSDAGHRFFLALLLNVPHRETILDLVGRRFPGADPVETVCSWVRELAAVRSAAAPGLNLLSLEAFGDEHLFLLRRLLEGLTFEQVTETLAAEGAAAAAVPGAGPESLSRHLRAFRGSVLLNSLLS